MGSGLPISREIGTFGTNNLPVNYLGRLSDGRTPTFSQTDLLVQHGFRLGGGRQLQLSMNVLNLFNQDTAIARFSTEHRVNGVTPDQDLFYTGQQTLESLIASRGSGPRLQGSPLPDGQRLPGAPSGAIRREVPLLRPGESDVFFCPAGQSRGAFFFRRRSPMRTALFAALLTLACGSALAQRQTGAGARQTACANRLGLHAEEAWTEAAKAFQQAIDIDRNYEGAYHGLGLASMRLKKYSEAIGAYLKCRDLYRAQAGKQFANRQDAQRYRQDRLTEIDEVIRQFQGAPDAGHPGSIAAAQSAATGHPGVHHAREQHDRSRTRCRPSSTLALGSAYFRTEQLADAEREYKAAIAADPKSGEALQQPRRRLPADRTLQGSRRRTEVGGKSRVQSAPAAQAGHQGETG